MAVARNNTKLGEIPNVSLLPCRDCPDGVPCAKAGECYAILAMKRFPSARTSWTKNSKLARGNRDAFFAMVRRYLDNRPGKRFFRWHVAGDILDQDYLDRMISVAREYPAWRFLAFTKQHQLDYSKRPANLSVVFSMWPKWGDPRHARRRWLPICWMQDGTENRVPKDAIQCHGKCDQCGMCWDLPSLGRDVVIDKH